MANIASGAASLLPAMESAKGITLRWIFSGRGGVAEQSARFDAITSESYESLLSISSHPAETGSDIVDNAREEPRVVAIEALVSNTPIPGNPGHEDLFTSKSQDLNLPKEPLVSGARALTSPGQFLNNAIDKLINPTPSKFTGFAPKRDLPNRVRLMLEKLLLAQKTKSLIQIVARDFDIDNMMLGRIGLARTPDDGTVSTFTLEFTQVRIVSSSEVEAPVPTELRGLAVTPVGNKAIKDGDDAKNQVPESLASQLGGGAASLLGL